MTTPSDAIVEHHLEALGDGSRIAEQFAELHFRAVREVSTPVDQDSVCKRAVVALGIHSYHVYRAAYRLIIDGTFDVAAYLMRPLYDIPCLIRAVAGEPDNARCFLYDENGLRASKARKWVKKHDVHADIFLLERALYDPLNKLAHTGRYQAASLLGIGDEMRFPEIGGRADGDRVKQEMSIVLRLERCTLLALGEELPPESGPGWRADFIESLASHHEWSMSVRALAEQRNARVAEQSPEPTGGDAQ